MKHDDDFEKKCEREELFAISAICAFFVGAIGPAFGWVFFNGLGYNWLTICGWGAGGAAMGFLFSLGDNLSEKNKWVGSKAYARAAYQRTPQGMQEAAVFQEVIDEEELSYFGEPDTYITDLSQDEMAEIIDPYSIKDILEFWVHLHKGNGMDGSSPASHCAIIVLKLLSIKQRSRPHEDRNIRNRYSQERVSATRS